MPPAQLYQSYLPLLYDILNFKATLMEKNKALFCPSKLREETHSLKFLTVSCRYSCNIDSLGGTT